MSADVAFWIGERVPVRNRVLAAPMCGASKLPYRLQARRFGADVVCTEMVKAKPLVRDDAKTLRLLGTAPGEAPCAAQVCGADPARMARAAGKLEELGFPLIDLNMGCPVKKIVREGAGSALLKDPARIEALVRACVAAVDTPVTVKVRSGWAHQGHQDAATIARAAEAGGAALITIHARSREQRHDGPVDTRALAAAKAAVSIPVVANGGVTSAAEAVALLAESGCDAVMIGRGAHGRPWLFRDVARGLRGEAPLPPPDAAERLALMREHFEGLLELMGVHGVQLFRKHARWYFHSRPQAPEFVERLYRAREPEVVRALFAEWEALGAAELQALERG